MHNFSSPVTWVLAGLVLSAPLIGCDTEEAPKEPTTEDKSTQQKEASPAPEEGAAKSAKLFPESISKNPCSFLSAAQISKAISVPEASIKVEDFSDLGMCEWEWEGGGASISEIKVRDTKEAAQSSFEMNYASVSKEKAQAAMKEIMAGTKKELAEKGKPEASQKGADATGKALSGLLGAGLKFADVPDVADAARLRISPMTVGGKTVFNNEINVLLFNMYFSLTVTKGSNETLNRDEIVAVAQETVSGLKN